MFIVLMTNPYIATWDLNGKKCRVVSVKWNEWENRTRECELIGLILLYAKCIYHKSSLNKLIKRQSNDNIWLGVQTNKNSMKTNIFTRQQWLYLPVCFNVACLFVVDYWCHYKLVPFIYWYQAKYPRTQLSKDPAITVIPITNSTG